MTAIRSTRIGLKFDPDRRSDDVRVGVDLGGFNNGRRLLPDGQRGVPVHLIGRSNLGRSLAIRWPNFSRTPSDLAKFIKSPSDFDK
jgi:hypothetical protein